MVQSFLPVRRGERECPLIRWFEDTPPTILALHPSLSPYILDGNRWILDMNRRRTGCHGP